MTQSVPRHLRGAALGRGCVVFIAMGATLALAGPWDATTRYPRALRGAWMLGDFPGCRASEVPGNASDMVIRTDHIRQFESRQDLVSLQPMTRRTWRSTTRVSIDLRPTTLYHAELTLSPDGRRLTVSTPLSNGLADEEVFTRCR